MHEYLSDQGLNYVYANVLAIKIISLRSPFIEAATNSNGGGDAKHGTSQKHGQKRKKNRKKKKKKDQVAHGSYFGLLFLLHKSRAFISHVLDIYDRSWILVASAISCTEANTVACVVAREQPLQAEVGGEKILHYTLPQGWY